MAQVLEYRPKDIPQINNPLNDLFISLTNYVEWVVERRLSEQMSNQPNPEPKPLKLLKAKEVAAVIGCAETTINSLADSGKIPTATKWKEGTKTFRRFNLDEVLAALESK